VCSGRAANEDDPVRIPPTHQHIISAGASPADTRGFSKLRFPPTHFGPLSRAQVLTGIVVRSQSMICGSRQSTPAVGTNLPLAE
jgi:hypothetical protein